MTFLHLHAILIKRSLWSKPLVLPWLLLSVSLMLMSMLFFVSPGPGVSPPKRHGPSVRPFTFRCPRSCSRVCSESKSQPITAEYREELFKVPLHVQSCSVFYLVPCPEIFLGLTKKMFESAFRRTTTKRRCIRAEWLHLNQVAALNSVRLFPIWRTSAVGLQMETRLTTTPSWLASTG